MQMNKSGSSFYSGCQKDVLFGERIFLQLLIPPFRIAEHIFEKRYKAINGMT
jgi:hypothetical protein